MEAINRAGYHEKDVKLGMDCAASEFYVKEKKLYDLAYKMDKTMKEQFPDRRLERESIELTQLYQELVNKYPLISIEDPFDEEDWDSFTNFCANTKSIQVVGDDLLYTNVDRIHKAQEYQACNCLLLKVNQIGTVTEAISAAKLAKSLGWNVMMSHRSGETEDSFIADLAVGLGITQIKSGAPCRSERLSKYNQLLRIEEELGNEAHYPSIEEVKFGTT